MSGQSRAIEYFGGPHDGMTRVEGPGLARAFVLIYPNGWGYARPLIVDPDLEGWYGPAEYNDRRRYHRRYHTGFPPAQETDA